MKTYSTYLLGTLVAVILAKVFYPIVAISGVTGTHGGYLGLAALLVAAAYAWGAFLRNRERKLIKWSLQLPIAVAISFWAYTDYTTQRAILLTAEL